MTSKEAIQKIKKLLFNSYGFGLMKTIDGMEMKTEGDVVVESDIYTITPDGEMPTMDGDYEMEDGMKIKVAGGKITEITYAESEEPVVELEEEITTTEEETQMVSAELVDGTIVETESEELKVGDELFVITPEGRTVAPDGSHETSDGKIIEVLDGKIIEIAEKEEEATEETIEQETEMSELMDLFAKGFETINAEIAKLKEENSTLKSQFSKFSAEPAGERLYFQKDMIENIKKSKADRLELLSELRRKNK